MSRIRTARIAVENCAYSFDELFTFLVPEGLSSDVLPGVRVLVPFGRGSVKRQGFVFSVSESACADVGEGLKSVDSVLDAAPLLNDELLRLAVRLHDTCFCTYFSAAKTLLPGGMCMRTEKIYRISENGADFSALEDAQKEVCRFIAAENKAVRESDIVKKFPQALQNGTLALLERSGYICADKSAFLRVKDISVKKVKLSEAYLSGEIKFKPTEKQRAAVDFLSASPGATLKETSYYTGVSADVVKRLADKGVCEFFDSAVLRSPIPPASRQTAAHILSQQQRVARDKLISVYESGKAAVALLFGVTGSGKTSVYLELIDRALEDGKTALVLVPEIALTPQTVALFADRYGDGIALLHSALSNGERYDEWKRIKNGKARVVIGTRSAVFAPLDNIGVIIIDEEQEHTYKSEMSPRYNAKEAARFRSAYHACLLVLASATPSVETYAKAAAGKYVLCELPERYGNAVLPEVVTVDMTDKELLPSFASISVPLENELRRNLDNGEQSILLINRRGYNTFVVCKACKRVICCPKCSISLTYHSANNRLMCHYCGYSSEYTDKCPECGEKNIRYSGFGTQRVEQELKVRFPTARILRMDADTTAAKNAHDKAFSAFADGEYDIMLGTQMVAKGLDFPNVTLVGVTSADNELYNDDFRSSERTFDLITQVVGRAGRGDKKGRAFIQTLTPDSNILSVASKQDYKTFFRQEMLMRRAMIYPPFCDICVVGFSSRSEGLTLECARDFFDLLKNAAENADGQHIIVLGPMPPRVSKLNDCYRRRIIIKCKNSSSFRNMISLLLKKIMSVKKYKNVSVFADINPENADI